MTEDQADYIIGLAAKANTKSIRLKDLADKDGIIVTLAPKINIIVSAKCALETGLDPSGKSYDVTNLVGAFTKMILSMSAKELKSCTTEVTQ